VAVHAKEFAMRLVPGTLIPLALAALLAAGPAFALEPLPEERFINDSLRAGRIGDVIRKTCPTISARMVTVYLKIEDLKKYALDKGYTRPEIEAFIKDPVQKKRLRDEADAWLAAAGAVEGQPQTYCAVGEAEIAKGTLVGQILRSSR
jgi:hypothetical protein